MSSEGSDIHLSVVIPAFNEEERLPGVLDGISLYLSGQAYRSEILVVDDGYERLGPARVPGTPPDDRRTDALREELRRRAVSRSLQDPREDPGWSWELFERGHF